MSLNLLTRFINKTLSVLDVRKHVNQEPDNAYEQPQSRDHKGTLHKPSERGA